MYSKIEMRSRYCLYPIEQPYPFADISMKRRAFIEEHSAYLLWVDPLVQTDKHRLGSPGMPNHQMLSERGQLARQADMKRSRMAEETVNARKVLCNRGRSMDVLRGGEQDLSSEVGATVQDSGVGKQCLSHGAARAEAVG